MEKEGREIDEEREKEAVQTFMLHVKIIVNISFG